MSNAPLSTLKFLIRFIFFAGAAELVLKALGERFDNTQSPKNLTILFGGGPGDYGERGLSHLAKVSEDGSVSMLKRTIGGHYGQVPKVADLVLKNKVEAWTLPMGSVSRMVRAQSTHSPGHITTIGLGTYVDPDVNGGAANEAAKQSPLHPRLVSKIVIENQTFLSYKALPINVGKHYYSLHLVSLITGGISNLRFVL
jgi:propionate CoA-transferase